MHTSSCHSILTLLGKRQIARCMKEAVFNYLVTNKAIFVYLGETNKHSSQIQLMYTLSIQDKQIHSLTHRFFFPPKRHTCPNYEIQHFTFSGSVSNTILFSWPKLARIGESKLDKRSDYSEIEILIRTAISAKEDNHKGNVSFDP